MSLPNADTDKNMAFKLEIEINSDKNNVFSLILNADNYSYLNIKAFQKNYLFNKSFSNKFTVDKIKENRYFLNFEDLKEICNELSERIKNKEIKLIENANNLIFIISLPSTKIKEITFELNEEQKNDKDKINNLNELIIELKNELNELKSEINENKKEIKSLKNEKHNQNNEIKKLKEQMKSLLKHIESKENISELKNSLIINNNIEFFKLINNWINPNKKIEGELLYRLSRDGEQISTFHSLCDNKGPTLTLFETKEGNKGGIYTPLSWDSNSNWKNDMETFIFNLNKNQKYKKLINDYSIYCYNTYGPWTYYGFGFYGNNQMRKIQHQGSNINSYYEKGAEILPNNSEANKWFEVQEVEVYKIMI